MLVGLDTNLRDLENLADRSSLREGDRVCEANNLFCSEGTWMYKATGGPNGNPPFDRAHSLIRRRVSVELG